MSPIARLRGFFDGSMRANAVALVAHQLASATLGFVYWLLAARLYAVETVGMSSAVISSIQLVSGIAQLGLVGGMQRFIPRAGRHARRLARSAYLVSAVSAAVSGAVALVVAESLAPGREWFGSIPPAWVVLAAVAWTLFYLQDGVLIGLREAVWVLVENFAFNLSKIVLLVVGAGLIAESGIIASWFVPAPIAVLFVTGLIFGKLLRPERLRDHDDPAEQVTAREIVTSVSGDHLGGMIGEASLRVLPVLVVALAGAAENAYFYQAWMISTVLGLVASGMANSFTADTAADRRRVAPNSRAILRSMSMLLLPAALAAGLGAPLVLRIFGEAYAREGAGLLRVLAVAVVPVIVNTWYVAYLRVVGRIRTLIAARVVSSVVLVGLAYVGLLWTGIIGVGIAWLVSQTGMALFAIFDTRAVLGARSAREHRDTGEMRRGDWRFLLPVPHPETIAVFAEGPLAHSARLVAATVVSGDSADAHDCDLCVADRPDRETLRRAFGSLRSCGSCYAEWPRPHIGGPDAVARLFASAGFDEPVLYWPAPWLGKAKLWVRVPTPGDGYRRTLRELLERSTPGSRAGKAMAVFAAIALRMGFTASLVAIARKPATNSEPCRSDEFCSWLEGRLAAATGDAAELMIVMRTGGASDENKVNWLVYENDGERLRWIAKAPRHPSSLPALQREHDVLERLALRPEAASAAVEAPRVVLNTREPGFPLFVQAAIHGTPLLRFALAEGFDGASTRVSTALASLVDRNDVSPAEAWRARLVEPWLQRLERQLDGIGDPGIATRVRQALEDLGPLPLGWTHNDCTPWNTVVTESGLGIFDWETADEQGLPAVDLVYCLATTAFSLDGTEGTSRAVDSYRRLMDPDDERGAAFSRALERYAAETGLAEEDLSRLRVMTWLLHTTHDLHNLLIATEEPTPDLLGECVCLPILQAELDRHRAAVPDAEAATAEALFLSPHLDDAVLSCGATIGRMAAAGIPVTIVTVFTADPPPDLPLSALARSCHEVWGAGDAPFASRREEDMKAAGALGASVLHLGFLDAIYRTDGAGRPIYDCSQRDAVRDYDEACCLAELRERLAALLAAHPRATVFCPAGIGGHVDHVLVRRAAEEAGAVRLVYYDEYPYIAWTANTYSRSGHRGNQCTVRPDPAELDANIAASASYASQIAGLFPSAAGRALRIAHERMPRMWAWAPSGTGAPERALARMASRLRRDKQRYGERFHWQDAGWGGPFGR